MRLKRVFFGLVFQLLCVVFVFAQNSYKSDVLKYGDYIYKESIKSLTLSRPANAMSLPVITLGGRDQLSLRFDELS